jgi:multidrug resistance efflux pump
VADSGEVILESKVYVIAAHQVQVSPKVAGMIVWLDPKFEEGQRFEKNAVLAMLETDDYEADRNHAQSALAMARERLAELERSWPLEIQQALARLANAKSVMDYREREANRVIAAGAGSSTKDRDEALSHAVQARKSYDDARASLALLDEKGPRQQRIAAARAEVQQAEAELKKAEWRLGNCKILAPLTGTILSKKAEKGNIVNPVAFNISASLCEMADLRDLEVDLNIQERDIANVARDQQCDVMPEAYQKNEQFRKKYPQGYRGVVSRLMPIGDRSKGAIPVRVKIDKEQIPPEEEGRYLKPEMGVIVKFKKLNRGS